MAGRFDTIERHWVTLEVQSQRRSCATGRRNGQDPRSAAENEFVLGTGE